MASRRSLTTTTAAAGAVLIALCFMPTASASPVKAAGRAPASTTQAASQGSPASTTASVTGDTAATGDAAAPGAQTAQAPAGLADTGAVDTTPYVVGGAGFLGVGAALLLAARRRALMLEA
ncbi:hypothetical protein POF50_012340 [Streptomyces sp. SL13]|uniref:LPXTG cell wall anchor domain-containing protein n=1 Tax=Streptantibioticus silvisoli TaxID=2705255 RepID=A0AA90H346_9ACTN|nr:hypothetical protein [Streptantibioticus silvisoli]MDI5966873.1 hypothetical protein [Streptantibioticus silvisoli]MDI5970118.1 hypothetical protein [Streptantibioticus silvisoli]